MLVFNELELAYDNKKTQTQKIQAEKTNLDLTNLNISAENQRLQLAVDNHIHEKMDLRNQIQSLTKTNSEQIEKLNSLQNQIKSLEHLTVDNLRLQTIVDSHSQKTDDIARENTYLLSELDHFKSWLDSEKSEHEFSKAKILDLENLISEERNNAIVVQQSLKHSTDIQEKLNLQLNELQDSLNIQKDEHKLQERINAELSMVNNTLEEKISDLNTQLMTSKSEKELLKEKISKMTPASQNNGDRANILEQQVIELTAYKCQAISSVDHLRKQNDSLKSEVQKLSASLEQEILKQKSLSESVLEKDNEIQVINRQMNELQNHRHKLDKQLSFSTNKITSLKECLYKENEVVKDYEVKAISRNNSFSQLQDVNSSLSTQLEDMKTQNSQLIQSKLSLEEQINVEKDSSQKKDLLIAEQVLLVESLQQENKSQRDRIALIKSQYNNFVTDSQAVIAKSKHDYAELQSLYVEEQEKRKNLETIKAKMTKLVMDLEFASKKESAERQKLDQLLEAANHTIEELESKMISHRRFSSDLTLDSAVSNTPHKIPRKSRLSLKTLFKSPGNFINVSKSTMSVASVDSIESPIYHDRCQSIDTCAKSQISLGIVKDSLIISS